MKRIISLIVLIILTIAAGAFAADTAPVVAASTTSFMSWIMKNSTAIFVVALAVSEFMALIPGLKGNGILDTIIKALSVLSKKQIAP